MAKIYDRVGGRKLEKVIALNEGVQAELEYRAFEIGVRAEQILVEHRQEGHASIEVEEGDVDKYVILSDERGQKAALSIEYGRDAYGIDEHGNTVDADSPEAVRVVGAMEGLYILARASNLPKKRKGRVQLD